MFVLFGFLCCLCFLLCLFFRFGVFRAIWVLLWVVCVESCILCAVVV